MAGPLAGISAAQVAQQKVPDQVAQQAKSGPSKFDHALKGAGVEQAAAVHQVDVTHKAAPVQKTVETRLDKKMTGKGMDPVSHKAEVSKGTSMVMSMMANLEKGQANIDKLINGGLSGKSMSNQELLVMQAGMYKYTQELDLCSKVVEKATSGLKDTLKTQV